MATRNKIALASASRTATINSVDLGNPRFKGAQIIVDMTAVTATGAVTFKVQGKNDLTGDYYDLIESTAISTVVTTVLKIYPSMVASANLVVNDVIPETFRIVAFHGNAVAMTYSVGVNMNF